MMKLLMNAFPALASFGPIFMVIGCGLEGRLGWIGYAGALMTSVAILTVAREMQRLLGSSHKEPVA